MRATSPATIYVISAAGEVARKIVATAPTDKGLPEAIRVVKNKVAVKFSRSCDSRLDFSSCQGTTYTVMDATTGESLADYGVEKEAAATLACYAPDPDRFFTFSVAQHHLEIVEAPPR